MISICNTLAEEENRRRSVDLIGAPKLKRATNLPASAKPPLS